MIVSNAEVSLCLTWSVYVSWWNNRSFFSVPFYRKIVPFVLFFFLGRSYMFAQQRRVYLVFAGMMGELSVKDKELIRGSWESLGINKVPHGVIMFSR